VDDNSNNISRLIAGLLDEYGEELCGDQRRIMALLADLLPGRRREASVLGQAIRQGIPDAVRVHQPLLPADIARLAARLYDNAGIAKEFGAWAVQTWAEALGHSAGSAGAAPVPVEVQSKTEHRVLSDHSGAIADLQFSDDGKSLASASRDGAVRVWSVATGWSLQCFDRHPGGAIAVAMSPDGDRLVSSAAQETALRRPGQNAPGLKGHKARVGTLDFSPRGEWMASGDNNGVVRLWKQTGRRIFREIAAHDTAITALKFSPNGQRLVTACEGGQAQVFDVASARSIAHFELSGACLAATIDQAGSRIILGGADTTARMFDVESTRELLTIEAELPVAALALAPDGVRLAIGTWGPVIGLWDIQSGVSLANFVGHSAAIGALAMSPDGLHLASGSADHTIRIWPLL
jgi:WD40 repeat protein